MRRGKRKVVREEKGEDCKGREEKRKEGRGGEAKRKGKVRKGKENMAR